MARTESPDTRPRVLVDSSNLCAQFRGGKEEQILQTVQAVNASGMAAAKLFDKFEDELTKFDIYHIFGLHPENVETAALAVKGGLGLVCTPVFWKSNRFHRESSGLAKSLGMAIARSLARSFPSAAGLGIFGEQRLIDLADVVVPSSRLEADVLLRTFRLNRSNIQVIENGVDPSFAQGDSSEFERRFGISDFLLYVGRIEPRKNIARLARAAAKLGETLVIIGSASFNDRYLSECLRINPGRTFYLGSLPHDSAMLRSAYKAAKVFALPSWFETPGIAALEAGVAGCRIVITDQGSTREYFRDDVEYCNPGSVDSICDAIHRAERKPRPSSLAPRLTSEYAWDTIGRRMGLLYSQLTK